MPDHCHLLWAGLHCQSDQSQAMRQFRRDWNVRLKPYSLDRQAYDHVLRAKERERDALQKVMAYIWNNPVRKGLASEREDWEFSGTFFPGYPTLDFRKEYFYVNLWKAFNEQVERFG
jgi:REP element-mobilizing transposase RayT